MKTLETIQKTCKVFNILAKVAMILAFVWAGSNLIFLLCGIVWKCGGNIVGVPLDYVLQFTETESLEQMICVLVADFVLAVTDGLLFLFAWRYFQKELKEGTPFTTEGAERVQSLGIKTIVLPLVAVIIAAVVYQCFGITPPEHLDNGAAVVFGIALILFSMVLRHGAELRAESEKA